MKTIALIDPYWTGHHPMYMKILTKHMLSFGLNICVLCPEPQEVKNYINVENSDLATNLRLFSYSDIDRNTYHGKLGSVRMSLARWKATQETLEYVEKKIHTKIDLAFFMWLDDYVINIAAAELVVDRIFHYPWTGIYFKPMDLAYPEHFRSSLRNPNSIFHAKNCKAIGLLVETFQEQLSKRIPKKVYHIPDFTDEANPDMDYPLTKEIKKRAQGRTIIGIVGVLYGQKNMRRLLEIAKKEHSRDWYFVFAGKFAYNTYSETEMGDIIQILSNKSIHNNCFFHFDRIGTEAQFNAIVNTCDIIYAAYRDFPFSSNTLNKVALFKKPVIATKGCCMGDLVTHFGIGITVDPDHMKATINAVESLAKPNAIPKKHFNAYAEAHSQEKLNKTLAILLRDQILT